jgi:hypothetical protein
VLEQYLKHHFYEHPSISAVLARHLADIYIKPEASPTAQITALDKLVKSISSQVDKLGRRRIKERRRRKNSPDYLLSQIQQWSALGQTLYPALPRSL